MNSTHSTRRFVTALASLAALALGAFALGLLLDSHALALFCVGASTFTIMIVVHDYTPALSYPAASSRPATHTAVANRKAERMPLAA